MTRLSIFLVILLPVAVITSILPKSNATNKPADLTSLEVQRYQEVEEMAKVAYDFSQNIEYLSSQQQDSILTEVKKIDKRIELIDSLLLEKYPYTKKMHDKIISEY